MSKCASNIPCHRAVAEMDYAKIRFADAPFLSPVGHLKFRTEVNPVVIAAAGLARIVCHGFLGAFNVRHNRNGSAEGRFLKLSILWK
jgi:hypothetical protein